MKFGFSLKDIKPPVVVPTIPTNPGPACCARCAHMDPLHRAHPAIFDRNRAQCLLGNEPIHGRALCKNKNSDGNCPDFTPTTPKTVTTEKEKTTMDLIDVESKTREKPAPVTDPKKKYKGDLDTHFCASAKMTGAEVDIVMTNGATHYGTIDAWGTYSIRLNVRNKKLVLVYKHGIATMTLRRAAANSD